jgi:hypothetical protein
MPQSGGNAPHFGRFQDEVRDGLKVSGEWATMSASGAGNRTPVTLLPELTWLVTIGIDGSFSRNQVAGTFECLKLFTKDRYEWGLCSNSPISRHLAQLNLMPYTRYCTRHDTYITPHLYIWLLFTHFDLANKTRFQNLVGSMLERGNSQI